jgi:hypothetical protein
MRIHFSPIKHRKGLLFALATGVLLAACQPESVEPRRPDQADPAKWPFKFKVSEAPPGGNNGGGGGG